MVNVMVVDTGTTVCEELAPALRRSGVTLLRAANPRHALELASVEQPDAVVINLTQPARVGDFAFSVLRFNAATARLPVVFLIDRLRWGRRANDAAADALVPLPWTADRVLAAVHRVVARDTQAATPLLAKEG